LVRRFGYLHAGHLPSLVPSVRDQAVCLRVWEWSETSQTAALFSRDHGVLRVLAKGARRADVRFSGGLDVASRGEMVAIIKPAEHSTDAMATLTAWDLQEVFPSIRTLLPAYCGAMYMIDLVRHAVRDADPHPDLFDALIAGLRSLGAAEASARGLLRFQWQTLVSLGYRPELHDPSLPDVPVLRFSPAQGRIVSPESESRLGADEGPLWKIRTETIKVLRELASTGTPAPGVTTESLNRANRFLAWYFRAVLGTWPPSVESAFPGIGRVEP